MDRFLFLILVSLFINPVFSQENGDFRSRATANWTSASTWEVYNGTTWVNATQAPQTNVDKTIEIVSPHVVTYTLPNQSATFNLNGEILVNGGTLFVNVSFNGNNQVTVSVSEFRIESGIFEVNLGNNPTFVLNVTNRFVVNGGILRYSGGGSNSAVYFDCKGDAEVNACLLVDNANPGQNLNSSGLYFNGNGTASNPQKLTVRSNISPEARRRFYATVSTYVQEEYAGSIEQQTVFGNLSSPRVDYVGLQN